MRGFCGHFPRRSVPTAGPPPCARVSVVGSGPRPGHYGAARGSRIARRRSTGDSEPGRVVTRRGAFSDRRGSRGGALSRIVEGHAAGRLLGSSRVTRRGAFSDRRGSRGGALSRIVENGGPGWILGCVPRGARRRPGGHIRDRHVPGRRGRRYGSGGIKLRAVRTACRAARCHVKHGGSFQDVSLPLL
jgi:hypothetical protein